MRMRLVGWGPGWSRGSMSEYACGACKANWTHEPRPKVVALGWGVVALGGAVAVGMLLLIHQNYTNWGGVLGAASLLCMGLGMWMMGRGLPCCPECGSKSVQSPASSHDAER